MRTRLHIKGKKLWSLCALCLLAYILTFCHTKITGVTGPATAVVGQTIDLALSLEISTNSGGSGNYMCAVLMPKGWKGAQNMKATYTSSKGSGNMVMVPTSTIATGSNGLTWPVYLKNKFSIAGNLIDDMEWVMMQTDAPVTWANGDKITGTINFKLTVGADGNPTLVKLAYVVCESADGLAENSGTTDTGYGVTAQYYNEFIGNCFQVTGGTGDLVDFCNPQLTTIDPPKSLDNDIITLSYNDKVVTSTAVSGKPAVYLCATATTSDGKTITVCEQTSKTILTQTAANSGLYKITLWPRKFFGVTDTQTILSMTYYITDQTGALQVGYGNTSAAFSYKFKCT